MKTDSYDQLIDLHDRSNLHRAALGPVVTTISQLLNGGCSQLAGNNRLDEARQTSTLLARMTTPAAEHFANLLEAAMPAMTEYGDFARTSAAVDMDETELENWEENLLGTGTAADALEDWIYDDANAAALYLEILAHFA